MPEHRGQVVRSLAGRDRGRLFFSLGSDPVSGLLLLADGKHRKLAAPKRKKPRHVEPLQAERPFTHPAVDKLKLGEPVTDRELRRALAAFKEGSTLG